MKKLFISLLALSGTLTLPPALAVDTERAEELYNTKTCVACHAIDIQMVGPGYKDVAARYSGQDDAVETLVGSIKNGSQGKWGSVPMPPNAVSDEEARILAEWILNQNQ